MRPPRCGKCEGRILADADGARFCIVCGWNDSVITHIDREIEYAIMSNSEPDDWVFDGSYNAPYSRFAIPKTVRPEGGATPRMGWLTKEPGDSEPLQQSLAYRRNMSKARSGTPGKFMRKEWFQ